MKQNVPVYLTVMKWFPQKLFKFKKSKISFSKTSSMTRPLLRAGLMRLVHQWRTIDFAHDKQFCVFAFFRLTEFQTFFIKCFLTKVVTPSIKRNHQRLCWIVHSYSHMFANKTFYYGYVWELTSTLISCCSQHSLFSATLLLVFIFKLITENLKKFWEKFSCEMCAVVDKLPDYTSCW